MNFRQWFEMAAPRQQDKEKVYYHGTESLSKARGIMVSGLDPAKTVIKYGGRTKAFLAPQAGRIYITPSIYYATIYALGGSYIGSKMPEAWASKSPEEASGVVFEIDGSQLSDITPDEDQVGSMLHLAMIAKTPEKIAHLKQFYTSVNWDVLLQTPMVDRFKYQAKYCLTDKQYAEVQKEWGKGGEMAFQANVGKKMVKCMNDEMKHWLIDAGAHVAHAGALHPTRAWIIDKKDSERLSADGSNFFRVARPWS